MTITQRVQSILEFSKAARNDDKELWLIYAQKSGVDLTPLQIQKIKNMPSFETLRRVRQKIQQVGRYKAAPEVEAARKYKSVMTRRTIPFMQPDEVERTIDGRVVLPFGE